MIYLQADRYRLEIEMKNVNLDAADLDTLVELVNDRIDAVRDGEITGFNGTVDDVLLDLMALRNKLTNDN